MFEANRLSYCFYGLTCSNSMTGNRSALAFQLSVKSSPRDQLYRHTVRRLGCDLRLRPCLSAPSRLDCMRNAESVFNLVDGLHASVGPGQRSRMAPTLSRRTMSATDYLVDENALPCSNTSDV
jgi:hypothetical protein